MAGLNSEVLLGREIVLSLLGYHGNIIILVDSSIQARGDDENSGSEQMTFMLHPDYAINDADRRSINRVCELGSYYLTLSSFASIGSFASGINTFGTQADGALYDEALGLFYDDNYLAASPDLDRNKIKETIEECDGHYFRAICRGIDEILDDYRQKVLEIEQLWMQQPNLPISYIYNPISSWHLSFMYLKKFVNTVANSHLRGCELIDLLYDNVINTSGIESISNLFRRLEARCRNIMYNQVIEWMSFGILNDAYSEFFIQKLGRNTNIFSLWEEYDLRSAMLPSFIPVSVAEKILFVGKAVQLLLQKDRGIKSKQKSIATAEIKEFSTNLETLKSHVPFHLPSFEHVIESFRINVSRYLWDFVVVESNLIATTKAFKDYFLLGNGDLWQTFIEISSKPIFSLPPRATAEADLNTYLQLAAQKIDLSDDDDFKKLKLLFAFDKEDRVESAKTAEMWDSGLSVQFEVPWPMTIIFSKPVIEKYVSLFKLLLSIRKVQLQLEQIAWRAQMQCKRIAFNQSKSLRSLWQLRMDIIEVQFAKLESGIKEIGENGDFERAIKLHEDYLESLHSLCFLKVPAIQRALRQVMLLCSSYCTKISHANIQFGGSQGYEPIATEFDKQASLLVAMLGGVRLNSASSSLAQIINSDKYTQFLPASSAT